jgi:hypothetical protein
VVSPGLEPLPKPPGFSDAIIITVEQLPDRVHVHCNQVPSGNVADTAFSLSIFPVVTGAMDSPLLPAA